MSQEDVSHKRFHAFEYEGFDVLGHPAKYKGFNVIDYRVFDEALKVLEGNIHQNILNIEENALIVIEFARDDYDRAFKQFSQDFLQNAYFILIDTDLEICKQRIHERVTHYTTPDDHFVSDFALDTHYFNQRLPKDRLIRKRFKVVKNQQSWQPFSRKINRILKTILNIH